jgi:nucleotidyltransferase/DNA polymerase involved in DNA repair
VVAHLDLDSFFVAVERGRRPEITGRPVVIGGRPGGRGMVAAASREARRCGIRVGMPLAQASLRCPDGVFLDGAFDAYFAAALQVDERLRRESPDIEWQSIDEVSVGLAPASRSRASVAIVERMQRTVQDLGFDVSVGLARSKLVARVASTLGRPRGMVHVLDGYEARFLSPLKIEMLPGIDSALARRLRAAGIRRLGQIARLPEPELARLAGRAGATLARHAAGIDDSSIRRTALPPARIEERLLAEPSAHPPIVHAAVLAEVERLGRELRSRGVFARTLTLRLRFPDGRVDSRTLPLPEATALNEALHAGALELLARLWTGDRLVRALALSCAGLLPGSGAAALFPLSRSS